jgi:hypothetical protein
MAPVTDVIIGTSATPVLDGTEASARPIYLQNISSEEIVLTVGTGDTRTLPPKGWDVVLPGMVVTATSTSGTAVLQVLRGLVPGPSSAGAGYDASVGGDQVWRLNPEWAHILEQQESASGKGDGPTVYHVDFSTYSEVSVQFQDTPGATGTNTYKIYASAEADGAAAAAATYVDVGSKLFGAASWTTSDFLPSSQPFRAQYLKIEVVRSGDGGSNDGAWTIDIQAG